MHAELGYYAIDWYTIHCPFIRLLIENISLLFGVLFTAPRLSATHRTRACVSRALAGRANDASSYSADDEMCHMRSRKASRVWCARSRGTSTAIVRERER
jgi:hypothetical protein